MADANLSSHSRPGDAHDPIASGQTEQHHDAGHNFAAHAKPYLIVGGVLFVFTLITVWLAYVNFDQLFGGHGWNFIIGMIVATFKVCLVAAIFMHLKGEKQTIWTPLYFTLFFFVGLFVLTLLHWWDPISSTVHATN